MTLVFALSIAMLTLLASWGLVGYARYIAERNADTLLSAAARRVRQELAEDEEHFDPAEFFQEKGREMGPDGVALFLVDAGGRVVQKSRKDIPAWPRTNRDDWRIVSIRFGENLLVLGLPWHKTETTLRTQAVALLGLDLFVTMAAATGAWLLVGRTLSPIDALSTEVAAASVDSLRVRLSAPSPDAELVRLVATLNGLLARLFDAAAAKGRFYAAASHELRTPLHTLSGHLEVGLSRSRTNTEYRAVLEEASRQTRRLTSLVQDLLLLAQLDTAPAPPPGEPVDVADICERTLRQLAPRIAARGLRVQTDLRAAAEILAPPTHAEMLVRNLIDNATKYAAEGGAVRVWLVAVGSASRLEIFNECLPLPLPDVGQLLEPFFRPDASRNDQTGGNGLGLAICHAIARADHWTLKLRQEAGGFRVCVDFFLPAQE